MVQPSISSQGSNSSIQVSWTKPSGNVEFYTVFLKPQLSSQESHITTNSTFVTFDGLSAGRIYSAAVVTRSGPRNSTFTYVSNATCKSPTFVVFHKDFEPVDRRVSHRLQWPAPCDTAVQLLSILWWCIQGATHGARHATLKEFACTVALSVQHYVEQTGRKPLHFAGNIKLCPLIYCLLSAMHTVCSSTPQFQTLQDQLKFYWWQPAPLI